MSKDVRIELIQNLRHAAEIDQSPGDFNRKLLRAAANEIERLAALSPPADDASSPGDITRIGLWNTLKARGMSDDAAVEIIRKSAAASAATPKPADDAGVERLKAVKALEDAAAPFEFDHEATLHDWRCEAISRRNSARLALAALT